MINLSINSQADAATTYRSTLGRRLFIQTRAEAAELRDGLATGSPTQYGTVCRGTALGVRRRSSVPNRCQERFNPARAAAFKFFASGFNSVAETVNGSMNPGHRGADLYYCPGLPGELLPGP
eukprot:751183-Hanusia_phi.AAC.1